MDTRDKKETIKDCRRQEQRSSSDQFISRLVSQKKNGQLENTGLEGVGTPKEAGTEQAGQLQE